MSAHLYDKWAYFMGYIVTCNEDGSIPVNSKIVIDLTVTHPTGGDELAIVHNALLEEIRNLRRGKSA